MLTITTRHLCFFSPFMRHPQYIKLRLTDLEDVRRRSTFAFPVALSCRVRPAPLRCTSGYRCPLSPLIRLHHVGVSTCAVSADDCSPSQAILILPHVPAALRWCGGVIDHQESRFSTRSDPRLSHCFAKSRYVMTKQILTAQKADPDTLCSAGAPSTSSRPSSSAAARRASASCRRGAPAASWRAPRWRARCAPRRRATPTQTRRVCPPAQTASTGCVRMWSLCGSCVKSVFDNLKLTAPP